jgi:diacylglycerol kinase family enzyme
MSPRVALIVNPFASRVTSRGLAAVERALGEAADVETRLTAAPGHAAELAATADGADAIVVFSGDGGYNEVLNGLERDVPIGFVPGGGTSVLARALGMPRRPEDAARRLAASLREGRTRRISLGRANGRRFTFSSGIGLDAEALRRLEARGRDEDGKRAGDVAFAWTLGRLVVERRFAEPRLDVVGRGRAAFVLVANCDPYTYAGRVGLHMAPEARFELGLDLVAPRSLRPGTVARFASYVLRGEGQQSAPDIVYGHDLDRIEVVCDEPMPLQVDGEDLGDVERAVFEAERDAVTVLV